jgi:hypothetical protein
VHAGFFQHPGYTTCGNLFKVARAKRWVFHKSQAFGDYTMLRNTYDVTMQVCTLGFSNIRDAMMRNSSKHIQGQMTFAGSSLVHFSSGGEMTSQD